jgi:hypothetical protein
MTTPEDLLAQIESLPDPMVRKARTLSEERKVLRARVRKVGGTITTLVLTAEGNAVVRWALGTPGMPVTMNKIVDQALQVYQAKHRGEHARRILSQEATHKMDQMIRERPELTEGELLDLAIRHLYHSFEVSQDGLVDT